MRFSIAHVSVLLLAVAGCTLLDGDDDRCAAPAEPRMLELVDPTTLDCQTVTACSGATECSECSDVEPFPLWGACTSPCTGLDEAQCSANASCHIAISNATDALTDYIGCFALDTSSPATGACSTLDAYGCATRPDCEAIYNGEEVAREFVSCAIYPG